MSVLVYIEVKVSCGCTVFFGPTLDNGLTQPLRETCSCGKLWVGSFLPKTREAIVGRVTQVTVDERSYAVEALPFSEMYLRKFPSVVGSEGQTP